MSLTFEQAGRKLTQVGQAIPEAQAAALRRAAMTAKRIADETGGTMRNMGRKGANLTAGYTLSKTEAHVKPRPAGAWRIAEAGATPHLIGIGRGKRRKVGGYIFAAGYAHPVRSPVAHPGAKARLTWTRAVKILDQVVPKQMADDVAKNTVRKIFA